MSRFSEWFFGVDVNKALDSGDNLVNKLSSGIDKLVYTEQEKAVASQKAVDSYLKFINTQKDENSIRSRARRVLAFGVTGWYLGGLSISSVLYKFDPAYATFLFDVVKTVSVAFGGIMLFYFGTHLLRARK